MVKNRFDLFALNTRKPVQKVLNGCAISQVFEQGADRHPGPSKYPGSTDFARYLFDSMTGAPIAHPDAIMLFVLLLHLHTLPIPRVPISVRRTSGELPQ